MNKVILSGRLVADPELRTTQSGTQVATYRIAVDRRFTNQQGEREADFFNCIAWKNNADFAGRYLRKGTKILIEGRLQSRSYDAQDGSKRHVTEVVVDSTEFCESKNGGGSGNNADVPPPPPPSDGMDEVDDDELPF